MSEDLQIVSNGLTKFVNKMLFKDVVEFSISIEDVSLRGASWFAGGLYFAYRITVKILVDHSKIWKNSGKFSYNYLKMIEKISYYGLEDNIEEYCSYFGLSDKEIRVKFEYSHFNIDVYNPILDFIGTKNIDFVTSVHDHSPWFMIKISNDFYFNPELINDEGFDIDAIVITNEDISH